MTRLLALPTAWLLAIPASLFVACSSAPRTVDAREVEAHDLELQKQDAKRRDFQAVLVRLDQGMDSYAQALANRGEPRADKQVDQLGKLLEELVLDNGRRPSGKSDGAAGQSGSEPGENFLRLQALAADGSVPERQAIALAALGFSGRRDMMPLIVQGAMLKEPYVVDHAVLGLAVLRAPDTPVGVLAAIAERQDHPQDGRVQAAWALHQIQTASPDPSEIVAIWRRFVTSERDRLPDGVLVNAVRGLGLTGDKENAKLVAEFLRHPTPRLRMAAALAIGRLNAQEYWPDLLDLLSPRETVQNVRLHARKGLAALAGNQDYGYDMAAWRKVFDRGQ